MATTKSIWFVLSAAFLLTLLTFEFTFAIHHMEKMAALAMMMHMAKQGGGHQPIMVMPIPMQHWPSHGGHQEMGGGWCH